MEEQVRKIIETEVIDVIVASQIDMMRYLELAPGIPAILEEAEVTSFYDRVQETQGSARLRAQLTLDKLAHALHVITEHGTSVTVVSEAEREYIRDFAPDNTRIEVIPNGVDTHIFHPNGVTPEPHTLIYPGAVTYSANYDAVSYFIYDVLPLVRQRIPQVQFTVTGETGRVDVSHLVNQPGVVFSGYLDSVAAAVQHSWATVVPLRQGGGTRLKILESMALGTPVISTHKGAEGLHIHPGQDILIANTPEEMADAIYSLFESSQLRASLAANGRALVEGEYDWTVISGKLLNLIEEVGGKGA
jgi:glycosyltransferase involved in cell wall biosynthesis